jgi:hypothetical protein
MANENVTNIPASIDYTSRDYFALREALIARVQKNIPTWDGTDPTDFGVAMVEAFAYMGDIVNYYLDRVANEAYLATATQRQNLLNIAESYGYTVTGYVPSETTLEFINSSDIDTIIPIGTVVYGEVSFEDTVQDVYFTTTAEITVPAEGSEIVSATHGYSVTSREANFVTSSTDVAGELVGSSDGQPGQRFVLNDETVVASSVDVYVQNGSVYEKWTQINHLMDANPYDPVFYISYDELDYVYINFGDGISGAIPPIHSSIKVVYTVGGGTIGNVAINVIDTFFYVPGLNSSELATLEDSISLSNTTRALGGSNPESNTSIRINSPLSLRTFNRLVTKSDYENYAVSLFQVGKANVSSEIWNSVNIYVAPISSTTDYDPYPGYNETNTILNETLWYSLENSVRSSMEDKLQIGVSLSILPPVYVPVTLTVQFVELTGYNSDQIKQSILSHLLSVFSYNNQAFQQVITPEKVEYEVQTIFGVRTAKVVSLYRTGSTTARTTLAGSAQEIFSFTEESLNITRSSSDSTLGNLTVTGQTMVPIYDPEVPFYNYNVTLPNGTTSVVVVPVKNNSSSTVTVNGTSSTTVSTAVGVTTATIVVTAGDAFTSTTYTINFTRSS